MEHVRSVAVGVWVEAGSRHEPEGRVGMSHLIEHLVFKGTETRTAEAIARTMDSVGGQMDAFTTKEHTCFYVQVLDEHLPLAVDLLTDILLHPVFDAEELEREKSVVLQEIKMVEDTPDDLIHDLFAAQLWEGHPLGRPILGTREAVNGYDRAAVLSHFGAEYVPPRIMIAVAGNVTHDAVVDLFGGGFKGFAEEVHDRVVGDVASDRDHDAWRHVLRAEVGEHRRAIVAVHRLARTEDRTPERVALPELGGEEVVDQVVGCVLHHLDLLEHDRLFALELLGVEDRVEEDIGQEVDRERQMLVEHLDVEARVFLGGEGVHLATD